MQNKIQKIIVTILLSLIGTNYAFAVSIDELTPREGIKHTAETKQYTDVQSVSQLPSLTVESAITTAIKTILGWSIILALIAIIVAAGYYLIAQGQEDNLGKAKDIIVYLIIGLAIMAAAYAIVTGILKFKFFE